MKFFLLARLSLPFGAMFFAIPLLRVGHAEDGSARVFSFLSLPSVLDLTLGKQKSLLSVRY